MGNLRATFSIVTCSQILIHGESINIMSLKAEIHLICLFFNRNDNLHKARSCTGGHVHCHVFTQIDALYIVA